jgi:hypothetical protein
MTEHKTENPSSDQAQPGFRVSESTRRVAGSQPVASALSELAGHRDRSTSHNIQTMDFAPEFDD